MHRPTQRGASAPEASEAASQRTSQASSLRPATQTSSLWPAAQALRPATQNVVSSAYGAGALSSSARASSLRPGVTSSASGAGTVSPSGHDATSREETHGPSPVCGEEHHHWATHATAPPAHLRGSSPSRISPRHSLGGESASCPSTILVLINLYTPKLPPLFEFFNCAKEPSTLNLFITTFVPFGPHRSL